MNKLLIKCELMKFSTWRVGAPGTLGGKVADPDTAIRHRPEARSTIAHAAQLSPDQLCQPHLPLTKPGDSTDMYLVLIQCGYVQVVAMYLDEV